MSKLLSPQAIRTRQELLDLYREAAASGVPLVEIQKKIEDLELAYETVIDQTQYKSARWRKIIPLVSVTLGSILMANAAWPILSYQLFTAPKFQHPEFISPLSSEKLDKYAMISSSDSIDRAEAKVEATVIKPIVLSQQLDYTNLANWFVDSSQVEDSSSQTQHDYLIDIPSLSIKQAEIRVGGTDLNSSLIQYPGTAEPGNAGAPVIFGHSVLRQFYHPDISNPNRYKSIFSKIMTLKPGDEIFVTHEGVRYTYQVKELHDVQPTDTFILEQRHRSKDLKLVTCVPEGTYLRRGVVVAELQGME